MLTITPLRAKANNTLNDVMHGLDWLTALFRTVTLKISWKSINTAGLLHWYIVYNERSIIALNFTTMPTFPHFSTKIISSHPFSSLFLSFHSPDPWVDLRDKQPCDSQALWEDSFRKPPLRQSSDTGTSTKRPVFPIHFTAMGSIFKASHLAHLGHKWCNKSSQN